MSDPKQQPTPQDPAELDLDAETVADLEPESQDAEKVAGGKPCEPTRVQCGPNES